MNTISKQIRQLYYDYRSELVFGLVLCVLMLVSYWLATFIPEDMYTYMIDPAFTLSMTVGCFWCGWLMLRHLDGNVLRRSWAGVLLAWAAIEGLMLVLRINGVTAVGGTPDDPLFNAFEDEISEGGKRVEILVSSLRLPVQCLRMDYPDLKEMISNLINNV